MKLKAWNKNWPRASNTGILTKLTPTLDADILNEPAAIAFEELVRERLEERGYILPRIGKAPKRAIPCRTVDPFSKITTNLIAANGSTGEKSNFWVPASTSSPPAFMKTPASPTPRQSDRHRAR